MLLTNLFATFTPSISLNYKNQLTMKYRIKVITYANGRKEHFAQFKTFWGWRYVGFDGDTLSTPSVQETRDSSLRRIDKHFNGNAKRQTIEFEYINK